MLHREDPTVIPIPKPTYAAKRLPWLSHPKSQASAAVSTTTSPKACLRTHLIPVPRPASRRYHVCIDPIVRHLRSSSRTRMYLRPSTSPDRSKSVIMDDRRSRASAAHLAPGAKENAWNRALLLRSPGEMSGGTNV
ncbi:hypothetical protein CC80DRAFT_131274 [Byssothecium circinans]|uniref:Uncharacterized protein n=1 Tax=Byssothecium circinans TaxID=147558 RepID=A0A6A5TM67_9PLEO|nr:hypothetical protein CC80DRAFT_131274 [Byssothecium circinans]